MKWGHYQKECHKLLEVVFESKKEAYIWLKNTFNVQHFADLNPEKDKDLIDKIYSKLYTKSILEYHERNS